MQHSCGLGITSVAAFHCPNFEAPIETSRIGIKCTLANERDLVQERFVGAVREQMPKVMVVNRRVRVSGNTPLYPAVYFKSRFRRFRRFHHLFYFLTVRDWGWGCRNSLTKGWRTIGQSVGCKA